ncbi:MAG TPA: hypothetical protein VG269_15210 [Tepidisphaeraceae bacterium]|jgi:hypothetical protein|nr:hypothetical protein [Tepidisphaeraceae bacterium]
MTLVLELPPELERELTSQAEALRLPLEEYAVRVLAGARVPAPNLASGADLVAYWRAEGLVGIRSEIADAAGHARAIRGEAERRTQ